MPHTRPTTDLAKGGLFNILEHQFNLQGIKTLDLFGGTGSITYELASRGAADLTIVEKDPNMSAFIHQTAAKLGVKIQLIKMDVFKYLEQCAGSYDFIFAGPPYALGTIDELPRIIHRKSLLAAGGWFVLEHTPRNRYQGFPLFKTERNYGTTVFSFFLNDQNAAE